MTRDEEWLLKEKYNGEKSEGFFADCARLSAHEPLAYLIGSIPFLHTTIHLDSHPLIPRTETEFWVEKIIKEIKSNPKKEIQVLDLCAGSGCIGVAILLEVEMARVDFVEIDACHHATILKNILENNIDPTRTHIFEGDLFEEVSNTYDYILTNPPYIDPSLNRTTESVQKFEPNLALYGGTLGTEFIFKIIADAPRFLTADGMLVIEHEPEQSDAIRQHAMPHGFACTTHPDQFGVSRYTTLVRI